MKKRMFSILLVIACLFVAATPAAAEGPVVKYGSNNGDVWDLQFRLQILGYYQMPVDGRFGYYTDSAVRWFQRDYGLTADGIVGYQTWKTLKQVSVNAKELTMLARAVHGEARGESYEGKVAVAAVIMNRVQSSHFPDTVKEVLFQPRAFTAIDDGQYWLEPNKEAYAAAWDAVKGWDPSGGALYYFNPDTATSSWIWSRPQITKIDSHIFAK